MPVASAAADEARGGGAHAQLQQPVGRDGGGRQPPPGRRVEARSRSPALPRRGRAAGSRARWCRPAPAAPSTDSARRARPPAVAAARHRRDWRRRPAPAGPRRRRRRAGRPAGRPAPPPTECRGSSHRSLRVRHAGLGRFCMCRRPDPSRRRRRPCSGRTGGDPRHVHASPSCPHAHPDAARSAGCGHTSFRPALERAFSSGRDSDRFADGRRCQRSLRSRGDCTGMAQ